MHASVLNRAGEELPHNDRNIGIDVGLEAFATLSDGTRIENHRYYKAAQTQLLGTAQVPRRHTKSRSVVIKQSCCCRWRTNTLGTNGETSAQVEYWLVLNFGRLPSID